jgi:Tripartite ATP-independent periplasmic transporter, DctM component
MTVALCILGLCVLLFLGIPFWVAMGLGTVTLLWVTDVFPMTLVGEALFEGVDSFALIAIPLFVLTGDAMVRSGLGIKLLFALGLGHQLSWAADCFHAFPAPMRRTQPLSGGSRWTSSSKKVIRKITPAHWWLQGLARAF